MVLLSSQGKEVADRSYLTTAIHSLPSPKYSPLAAATFSYQTLGKFYDRFRTNGASSDTGQSTPPSLLSNNLDRGSLRVLKNLNQERNPELFLSDLISLAGQWNREGKTDLAVPLFHAIANSLEEHPEIQARISDSLQDRLNQERHIATGKAPWSQRSDIYLRQWVDGAVDPLLLAGFAAGTFSFQLGRWSALRVLGRSAWIRNPLYRQLVGTAAWGVGVGLESAAFNYSLKGLQWAVHDAPFAPLTRREFLGTALTLGLFRSSHLLGQEIMRWRRGVPAWRPHLGAAFPNASHRLLEGSLDFGLSWGALVFSHHLQQGWGWRYPMKAQGLMGESLSILLQLKLAGKIFQEVQPVRLRNWGARMDRESRWLTHAPRALEELLPSRRQTSGPWIPQLSKQMGFVSPHNLILSSKFSEIGSHLAMMSEFKESSEPEGVKTRSGMNLKPKIHPDVRALLNASPWPSLVTDASGEILEVNEAARELLPADVSWIQGGHWRNFFPELLGAQDILEIPNGARGLRRYQLQEIPLQNSDYAIQVFREVPVPSRSYLRMKALQESAFPSKVLQLMRGTVHDMNNLLSTLLIYFESCLPLIEEGMQGDAEANEVMESGRDAQLATEKLREQIQNFMHFTSGLSVPLEPVDLQQALGLAMRTFRHITPQTGHLILNVSEGKREIVLGNETILMSCLQNLIKNAIDATPDGGLIEVGVHREGNYVRAFVQDSGSGIDPSLQNRIMDAGFTTKGGTRGYGMGLYMVKTMVEELMGGRFTFESEVGKGTTVNLLLPTPTPVPRK